MTTEEKKEFDEMCVGMMNKYYDVEITVDIDPNQFSIHYIRKTQIRLYRHLKLININGMGVGQVHFITDNGSYVLVPWCYIISMFPSKENNR